MTAWLSVDMMNPLTNSMVAASCDKANFGWPCDTEVEKLRDAFARAPDEAGRKKIAADLQARAVAYGAHIHLGPYTLPTASDLVDGDYNDAADVFVLHLGGPDTDGDGLEDDWEMAYFNTLTRDGSGDYDGDGLTDKEELVAGTDPDIVAGDPRVRGSEPGRDERERGGRGRNR